MSMLFLGISTPEDETTTSQNAMVKEKQAAENCTTEPLKTGIRSYAPSEFTICDLNNTDRNTVVIQNTTE